MINCFSIAVYYFKVYKKMLLKKIGGGEVSIKSVNKFYMLQDYLKNFYY